MARRRRGARPPARPPTPTTSTSRSTATRAQAARAIARATGGAAFQLSGAFGAWRVVGPGHAWHVDLVPLRDGDIEADLAARDFTINAMAEPLAGGELLDPHGGRADLEARLVRMVSAGALADDPLRTLRAVRLVTELDLELDPATGARSRAQRRRRSTSVAAERVFGELKRVVTAERARSGLELMDAYGLTDAVLPELAALHGVEQNEFHHADVLRAHARGARRPSRALERRRPRRRHRRPARRAARRRAHARRRDALRRAAARRRQARRRAASAPTGG